MPETVRELVYGEDEFPFGCTPLFQSGFESCGFHCGAVLRGETEVVDCLSGVGGDTPSVTFMVNIVKKRGRGNDECKG